MQRSLLLLLLGLPIMIGASDLPSDGPVPKPKPAEAAASDAPPPPAAAAEEEDDAVPPAAAKEDTGAAAPASEDPQPDPATEPVSEIPTPEPKPETETPEPAAAEKPAGETPATPKPGPSQPDEMKAEDKKPEEPKEPPPPPPPPVEKEDQAALKACLADLATLGTKFKTASRIDEGDGCGIDQPIEVAEALPGIDTGGAQMRCETARALGHWLKDTVQPALRIAMPERRITGLTTGSTYACRLRNSASTGKTSEHAKGNAIDIAAFRLDDGSEVTMKPRAEDGTMEGAFQRTASAGACLHFTTVLSPGSDATHMDHLHLDVLERDSGYRYCR